MVIDLFKDGTGILHGNDGVVVAIKPEQSGELVIGAERFHVDGKTVPNVQATGIKPCLFVATGGDTYDCGLVVCESGKIKPVHRETETTVKLKKKCEDLEARIERLENALQGINEQLVYDGLDFII